MMSIQIRSLVAAALVAAPLAFSQAQRSPEQTSDFRWSDRIDAGRLVKAGNVNGKITIRQGSGDRVEVTAVKRWRRGDPASVRIEAKKVGDDVQICGLYDDQRACDDRHESRGRRRNRDNDDNDVSVDFTILLPQGVRIHAGTVNGGVDIAGATAEIEAATVNGEMVVEAAGGSLTASTVNGDLRSDFDVTVRGRIDPRNLSMHVGPPGGPRMRLTTVNGSVELRKR